MTFNENHCPIWGEDYSAKVEPNPLSSIDIVHDSERTGGSYRIARDGADTQIDRLSLEEKAHLTTWLIDQRSQGETYPEIDLRVIEHIKSKVPLAVHERANRMLRFIGAQTTVVGTNFVFPDQLDPAIYAWSESTAEGEIGYFLDFLISKGWLDSRPKTGRRFLGEYLVPISVRVTVEGRSHIEEEKVNVGSAQGFIAMWFDDSMKKASKEGIEPAIVDAGYSPMRIDKKLDVRKIDDEIVAQIRRSRFLVADCTHGETKSRGSVYWEAGFAYGLGIEVIYTCHKDVAHDLPFDTRQFPHIIWRTPADLRRQLKERISALLGDGPRI